MECHRSNVYHRIRCKISDTYRYMAVFIGRKGGVDVCFKKIWLRLRLAAAIAFVRCWCMGVGV